MLWIQVLVNGLALGGLYACIAAGFSLVWGVLNIINILHGSLIVLGGYLAFFAHQSLGMSPFLFAPFAGAITFALGYAIQRAVINPVMGRPVLMTLVLTFGLNLFLDNAMLAGFKADYRKINLVPPLGVFEFPAFSQGTFSALQATAAATQLNGAYSIIGGGDTANAVAQFGMAQLVSHVSTGGGASLELLEGKQLPGIVALSAKAIKSSL